MASSVPVLVIVGLVFWVWPSQEPGLLYSTHMPDGRCLEIHWVPAPETDPPDSRGYFAYRLDDNPLHRLDYRFAGRRDHFRFTEQKRPVVPATLMVYEHRHGLQWVFDPVSGYVGGNG